MDEVYPTEATITAFRASLEAILREVCDASPPVRVPTMRWMHVEDLPDGRRSYSLVDRQDFALSDISPQLFSTGFTGRTEQHYSRVPFLVDRLVDDFMLSVSPEEESEWPSDFRVSRIVRQTVETYLERTQAVRYDQTVVDAVLDEVVADVLSPTVTVDTITPLHHLQLSTDVVDLGNGIRLRKTTLADVERWLNPAFGPVTDQFKRWDIHTLHTVVEDTFEIPRRNDPPISLSSPRTRDLITILQLVTNRAILAAWSETNLRGNYKGLGMGRSASYDSLNAARSEGIVLDETLREKLTTAWRQFQTSPARASLDIAFRRWSSAKERSEYVDRLIDYWIGLESVFGRGEDTRDITLRLKMRTALWLGKTRKERLRIYDEVGHLYSWRSAIAHGAFPEARKNNPVKELREAVEKSRDYLERRTPKAIANRSSGGYVHY